MGTFKSKNDFVEHTDVCQCASITDCCCSCQKQKSKKKKENPEIKNKHAGLTILQNFAKCLLCGATDPHSHRPGVFRNRLEALEISFLHHLELSQHINQIHIGMNSWK